MLGSVILEVAIGVIFVYILVSVICTAAREIVEALLKTRAAYLERGIRELLRDRQGTGLAKDFYKHPLIASLHAGDYRVGDTGPKPRLFARGRGLPSYIPARNFALVLMDIAARGPVTDEVSSDPASPPVTMATVRANLLNIQNPEVRRVVLTALDSAQGDLNRAVLALEDWFDSGMDRVSGWYKRTSHWLVFLIALGITVALNVDTLRIADFLYRNDAVRAAMVTRAEEAARRAAGDTLPDDAPAESAAGPTAGAAADSSAVDAAGRPGDSGIFPPLEGAEDTVAADTIAPDTAPAAAAIVAAPESAARDTAVADSVPRPIDVYVDAMNELNALGLPLGWSGYVFPDSFWGVISLVIGWLLTAFAATLGAPFWFDVLNKVMVIRGTVKPKEKSPEEGSEDRQTAASKRARALEQAALAAGPALAAAGIGGPAAGAGVAAEVHAWTPGGGREVLATPRDEESAIDACDVVIADDEATPDEDLPPAEGGVEHHG